GYYYLRRAYSPVLASFKTCTDGGLELWLTNDTLAEVRDAVAVHVATFDGHLQWEASRELDVPASASRAVWHWSAGEFAVGADRYVSVLSSNGTFAPNRHFFVPIKDLTRQAVAPEMTVDAASANELRV